MSAMNDLQFANVLFIDCSRRDIYVLLRKSANKTTTVEKNHKIPKATCLSSPAYLVFSTGSIPKIRRDDTNDQHIWGGGARSKVPLVQS